MMSRFTYTNSSTATPTFYKKTGIHIMKILKQAIDAIHEAEFEKREELIQQYSNALNDAACALCAARDHEQYGRFLLAIDSSRYEKVLGQGAFHDPAILQCGINQNQIKEFLERTKPTELEP